MVPRVLLWLLVIFLGISLGAGLYEGRIVLPRWLSTTDSTLRWNAEASRADDTGRRFWAFVTTGPLTLLGIANLVVAWRAPDSIRTWWLAAAIVTLVDRAFTFSYFIPRMLRLQDMPDSPEAVAMATQWANLNYLRHAIVLVALLTALKTFSLFYQQS